MFKKIRLTAVFMCVLLSSTAANAIPIVDTIDQNVFVNWFSSYSYTHNLTDDGFIPGTATGGTIAIQFSDDENRVDNWGLIFVAVEDLDFDTDIVVDSVSSFSNTLQVNALAQVNASGMLNVMVRSLIGDFYVGRSVFTVTTGAVPEPAVLGLLGFGLLGLGLARRLRKS